MTAPYLLDTNVYCEFFQKTPPTSFAGLRARLLSGKTCSFYISEITSMEVYSVLGKYRRGRPTQLQKCERTVLVEGEEQVCSHVWRWAGTKRISLRLIRSLHKLVSDTEKGKGLAAHLN